MTEAVEATPAAPAPQKQTPSSGGAAWLVAAGILLSRLAGLIRQRVLGYYLATSPAADAYTAALRIPNFLQNLLGEGVLSASFIPVYAALRAGASGFMLKDSAPEQLVATLRLAALGDALVTPSRTRTLIERHARPVSGTTTGIDELTPRETEVLVLIARGLDNGEMGGRLHLSEATIRTHVAHILSKLQAHSRVQAVVAAYESGLVQPGS